MFTSTPRLAGYLGGLGREVGRDLCRRGALHRVEPLGADGQVVAAGKAFDLADVAERGSHHLHWIPVLLAGIGREGEWVCTKPWVPRAGAIV